MISNFFTSPTTTIDTEISGQKVISKIPVHVFEEHQQALPIWYEHRQGGQQLKEALVVHIDGHSDMGKQHNVYQCRSQVAGIPTTLDLHDIKSA